MSRTVSVKKLHFHRSEVEQALPTDGSPAPPPPTAQEASVSVPPRSRYAHFTDPYRHRAHGRMLDTTGHDLEEANKDTAHAIFWQRSMLCPNRRPTPGGDPVHLENCQICEGRQLVSWDTVEIRVTVNPVSWEDHFYMSGRYEEGVVRLTFPAGRMPQKYDRIVMRDHVRIYDEVLHQPQSGRPQVYKLQFAPIYVASAAAMVDIKEWPTPYAPPHAHDQGKALLQIPHDQIRILEGEDRRVYVEMPIPRGSAISFVYLCRPEFLIEKIESFVREFYDTTPPSQVQTWEMDQVESGEQGWNITAVARLLFQEDSNKRGEDQEGHWTEDEGSHLRSGLNEDIPNKPG